MSTTSSNLYAEKVFAEHSLSLWHLDDVVDYISLVSEAERNISTPSSWTLTNAISGTLLVDDPTTAIDSTGIVNKINSTVYGAQAASIKLVSPILFQKSDLNLSLGSFAISTYVNPNVRSISFGIGYSYKDSITSVVIDVAPEYSTINSVRDWALVSRTFTIPSNVSDIRANFYVSYNSLTNDSSISPYSFFINSMTAGQWSEQYYANSLGADIISLPNNLPYSISASRKAVLAKPYGLASNYGYYMVEQNSICAVNSGNPLVYGSFYSTRVTKNPNAPSFIVPGQGFMNSSGQYRDLTFEIWMSIQTTATTPRRILGPIASSDGLYVNDAFFILKIGNKFKSFFINEWDRPMLIAIKLSSTQASLILNGEEIISMSLDPLFVSFPNEYSSDITSSPAGFASQDWIGVYAYDDVSAINIDSVGIFPYLVPNIMEKRRWVYGQAVEKPKLVSGTTLGSIVSIDYPLSNYSKNYSYPDIGKWTQGVSENLSITNDSISIVDYDIPVAKFTDKTIERWYSDLGAIQYPGSSIMNLRPNSAWNNTEGYVSLSNLNFSSQETKAFYGLFKPIASDTRSQVLFYIENQNTRESLDISVQGVNITYTLNTNSLSGESIPAVLYSAAMNPISGATILVGLNIDDFCTNFGSAVTSFFGSKQSLSIYVGGKPSLSNTFSGDINTFGLCAARNLRKISSLFYSSGARLGLAIPDQSMNPTYVLDAQGFVGTASNPAIVTTYPLPASLVDSGDSYFGNLYSPIDTKIVDAGDPYEEFVDLAATHTASYTLTSRLFLNNFKIDVATNGYWQDYVPLSYFGKYYDNGSTKEFGFDYIQFNIGYPKLYKLALDSFDTSKSSVRTHISFQYLKERSTIDPNHFLSNSVLPSGGVIYPGVDWLTTKYEIVDDTIIYPPSNVDFKTLALVIHVEVVSSGKEEEPISLRSIQLSSQSLDSYTPNAINTKYGASIFPYTKTGEYSDYKSRNPIGIYRGSSPYLYLTGTSGIRMRDFQNSLVPRGISIPVNKNKISTYSISSLQMSIRYDDISFPSVPTPIFEIQSSAGSGTMIQVFVVGDGIDNQRGFLYAVDSSTGLPYSNVLFYVNGGLTKDPVLGIKSWTTLSLSFLTPILFTSVQGAINITGPVMVDNISHYMLSANTAISPISYNKWYTIRGDGSGSSFIWSSYNTTPWTNVLYSFVAQQMSIDGSELYKKYTGTDHLVVDTKYHGSKTALLNTNSGITLQNPQYLFYDGLAWKSSVINPA